MEQKIKTWNYEGMSALTIYGAIRGPRYDDPHTPSDPNDFKRCHDLLILIDRGHHILKLVAETYPEWWPFYQNWPKLEALYLEEKSSGKAPKLYKMMQEIHNNLYTRKDEYIAEMIEQHKKQLIKK